MLDTYAIHSGEVIRTMTPAEYVKVHNTEEARRRHTGGKVLGYFY